MSEESDSRYRAPALDKGLDILELLASSSTSLSQAQIAKALNRSSNEIYRMLNRLVRRQYVRRTDEDRFELTLKLFELANKTPFIRRLVSHATPILRQFAREAKQACHLVVYDRNVLVVIAQADAPGYWSIAIRVGGRMSLINTGSGHIYLAFATPGERQTMLEDQKEVPLSELPEDFEQRLRTVREQGYERMRSLQVGGVTNLTVPILGPMGSIIAALTCRFIERLDPPDAPDIEAALDALIRTGHAISQLDQET